MFFKHGITLLLVPVAASLVVSELPLPTKNSLARTQLTLLAPLQLELGNMYQSGQLTQLWEVAKQTDLTFNLVGLSSAQHLGCQRQQYALSCERCPGSADRQNA